MKLKFKFGTKDIEFTVEFKNRKTLAIEVEPSGEVNVISPMGLTENEIVDKVKTKASWIVKKQYEVRTININKINREAVSGESYLYLGRNYTLQLIIDESISDISKPVLNNGTYSLEGIDVKLLRGKFIVTTYIKDESLIKKALENWYREKALKKINERLENYVHFFNSRPSTIKVKEQKKRWGSCTSNDELLFNWRCVMAPTNVLDYIIVHEMCHMKYKDHSKEFWKLVGDVMPDYEGRRAWLRENGIKLDL